MKVKKAVLVSLLKDSLEFSTADKWPMERLQQLLKKLPELPAKELEDKEHEKLLKKLTAAVKAKEEIEILDPTDAKKSKPYDEDEKPGKGKKKAKAKKEEDDEDEEEEDGDGDEEDESDSEDDDEEKDDEDDDGADEDDEEGEDEEEEEDEDEKPVKKKKGKKAPAKKPAKKGKKKDEEEEEEDDDEDEEDSDEDNEEEEDEEDEEEEDEDEEDEKPVKKKKTTPKGKKKEESNGIPKIGVTQTIIDLIEAASEEEPISKKMLVKKLVKKFGPGTKANRDPDSIKNTVNSKVPTYLKQAGYNVLKSEDGYWIGKKSSGKKPKKKAD